MLESEVFEQHMGLVRLFANRHYKPAGHNRSRYDLKDIEQIASVGLLKAIRTFKPEKGVKFSTYAGIIIKNEIFMFYRKENKENNSLTTLDAVIMEREDADTENTFMQLAKSKTDVESEIMAKELSVSYESLIDTCITDERDKQIYTLYKKGVKQREIGKQFGISQSYVSRLEKRMDDKIHKRIKRDWINAK